MSDTSPQNDEVINEEVLPHRRMYNFLLPDDGTQFGAQCELDNEMGSSGNLKSLPPYDKIRDKLKD